MNIDLNLALQEDEECGEEHGLRQDDVQDEEYGNAALQLDLNLQALIGRGVALLTLFIICTRLLSCCQDLLPKPSK